MCQLGAAGAHRPRHHGSARTSSQPGSTRQHPAAPGTRHPGTDPGSPRQPGNPTRQHPATRQPGLKSRPQVQPTGVALTLLLPPRAFPRLPVARGQTLSACRHPMSRDARRAPRAPTQVHVARRAAVCERRRGASSRRPSRRRGPGFFIHVIWSDYTKCEMVCVITTVVDPRTRWGKVLPSLRPTRPFVSCLRKEGELTQPSV